MIEFPDTSIPDPSFSKKCPEITKLKSYEKPPNDSFWNNFPKNCKKTEHSSCINTKNLEKLINKCKSKWTCHEQKIANKALKIIKFGSKSVFKKNLDPENFSKNSNSAFRYGELITDTIAHWIKKEYVIGPFQSPPFKRMCINPLMSAVQKTKIRPILNLSAPIETSFNDALDTSKLRKLTMSSAKKFSQSLLLSGKDSTFAKSDLVDAYKIIPSNKQDWKYHGFKWLGRFFADTTNPFGSKSAPANFDEFGETITNITKTLSDTPNRLIHRQLDDIPIVSPDSSDFATNFTKTLKEVCKMLNVDLAKDCKKFEKAFGPTKIGVVLGIEFNSCNMTWKLPEDKRIESLHLLKNFLNKNTCTLNEFQKVHGKINDFAQLAIFLKAFRYHQNKFLQSLELSVNKSLPIPNCVKNELSVWAKCIIDAKKGFPIPDVCRGIPLFFTSVYSDAAGSSRNDVNFNEKRGAAAIALDSKNEVFLHCQKTWPKNFAKKFPNQSSLLEAVGAVILFTCNFNELRDKYVVCHVDNMSVVYAWNKKLSKNDEWTSIIIQTLHLIEMALPCKIFFDHTPRRSCKFSKMVDNLSRELTTTKNDLFMLENSKTKNLNKQLANWIENPTLDWTLPVKITKSLNQ